MGHAVERTSPKGGPFLGTCTKCGQVNLGMDAPLHPCPMDHVVSDEQALLAALDKEPDKLRSTTAN